MSTPDRIANGGPTAVSPAAHLIEMYRVAYPKPAGRAVRIIAQVVGCHPATVRKWRRPVAQGGTGGRIPSIHHPTILNDARARDLRLRPEHLVEVRAPAERAADTADQEATP